MKITSGLSGEEHLEALRTLSGENRDRLQRNLDVHKLEPSADQGDRQLEMVGSEQRLGQLCDRCR